MNSLEIVQDIEYLFNNLSKSHYDIYKLISIENYQKLKNSLLENIKERNLTKEQFEIELLPIFATLKDTHSGIFPSTKRLPVVFEWVNDGYYLIVTPVTFETCLGKKLISINNIDLKDFINLAQKYITFDNEDKRIVEVSVVFRNPVLINFLTNNNATKITFGFEDNLIAEIEINPLEELRQISITRYYNVSLPFLISKTNYEQKIINDLLYIRYSRCKEDTNYPINNFIEDIKNNLSNKPSKIAIDLRNNYGGNSDLLMPLIEILQKYNQDNVVKIYCFIDRNVFSSGILNTYSIKTDLNAVLVGQNTGQGVDHFGEVKSFQLPNSQITINYSTKYFFKNNEYSKQITPDVLIEPTIEEYILGKDAVLDHVLNDN